MENLRVEYEYTVRWVETRDIVQYMFGGDGLNPQHAPWNVDTRSLELTIGDDVRDLIQSEQHLLRVLDECRSRPCP